MPPRRASLPIYNLPEMQAANHRFWQAMRCELAREDIRDTGEALAFEQRAVPERIERCMLFTQVCGYPLQTIYRGQATLLGAPVYAADYCDGATHAGVFVVHGTAPYRRLEDLRGCRFVYNSRHSNSGMNLPRRAIADLAAGRPFFATIAETHSHAGNLERVARGEADGTCVDNVTFAFVARHRPQLAEALRILASTPPSPSIPFVTSRAADADTVAALRRALMRVARAPEWADARAGLMLRDIVPADERAYAALLDYERQAAALGYPALC
ncbi:MAG: phosphate/phosphite/phosphonate ABC transporter substrate-binding protein [Alphaproteobacteria bacterium]